MRRRLGAVAMVLGLVPIAPLTGQEPVVIDCNEISPEPSIPDYRGEYRLSDGRLVRTKSYVQLQYAPVARTSAAAAAGKAYMEGHPRIYLSAAGGRMTDVGIADGYPPMGPDIAQLTTELVRDGVVITALMTVLDGGSRRMTLPAAALPKLVGPFEMVTRRNGAIVGTSRFNGIPAAVIRRMLTTLAAGDSKFTGRPFDARNPASAAPCEVRKSDCFLTTATVEAVGLADDCWELRQLRAFRARHRDGNGAMTAAIARYPDIAPGIVAAVDARTDARQVWLRTWATGIVPAALAASLRCDRIAFALYRRMTERLGTAA